MPLGTSASQSKQGRTSSKTRSASKTQPKQQDAIKLLMADHDEVERFTPRSRRKSSIRPPAMLSPKKMARI